MGDFKAKGMSEGYTKLYASIVNSTIWREPNHIRVTWITMLVMANSRGEVKASIPGLADAARVTIDECKESLAVFQTPDEYSKSKEHDGRRIREIEGGWLILNHCRYRNGRDAETRRRQNREAQARRREKIRQQPVSTRQHASAAVSTRQQPSAKDGLFTEKTSAACQPESAQAEAKAEAYNTNTISPLPPKGRASRSLTLWKVVEFPLVLDSTKFHQAWEAWHKERAQKKIKPYGEAGLKALLKELEQMGLERALAAIQHSLKNGYQGIYEPNTYGQKTTIRTTTDRERDRTGLEPAKIPTRRL